MRGLTDNLPPDPNSGILLPTAAGAKPPAHGRQLRLLSQSVILEEASPPRLLLFTILAVAALVAGAIGWSAVARVTSAAAATGQVVPAGAVHLVQHLEGGIVREILIQDGELVERGQPLMLLDGTASTAELDQLQVRIAVQSLKAERLRATVDGREPNFSAAPAYAELGADQLRVLEASRAAVADQRQVLATRIAQRKSEVQIRREQIRSLTKQLEVLEQEAKIRSELVAKGIGSRMEELDAQNRLARGRGDLAEARVAERQAQHATAEARGSLAEFETMLRTEATTELADVSAELAETREAVLRLEDRVARLQIAAPVRGVVNGIRVKSVGGVIAPGEVLMTIVPIEEEMVVEARIDPRDIGYLSVGQSARIIVNGFDFSRYGAIVGTVERLSAATFAGEDGQPYYQARIVLARDYLEAGGKRHRILPGMTVRASITTGSQTLIAYLARPIYASLNAAFRER